MMMLVALEKQDYKEKKAVKHNNSFWGVVFVKSTL